MECTINRVHDEYFDQLHHSGHYYREGDIDLFAGLGLKKMRYPILWEHHQPDKYRTINWSGTESKLKALRAKNIGVIAGLVHHGSGPAFVNMMKDSFAEGLAKYAAQVAERFPWIEYYTPVNEPLTTARFCGLYGLWAPHGKSDNSFCRILINECKATVLAMAAIRVFNPVAKLVQTDDLAKIHSSPVLNYQAEFENERRWLSFDLLCGRVDNNHTLWHYLTDNGIARSELEFFMDNPCPPDILGINYYLTSERYLDECKENYPSHTHGTNGRDSYADVEAVRVGKVRPDGVQQLLTTAWDRYNIPIAITEIHLHCTREEQMRWLNEAWLAANDLKNNGIPVVAITPWALLGSFGWDQLLTRSYGTYEPGVFDISDGYPRPTILAAMISAYSRYETFQHAALDCPGWWKRSCRVAYGEDDFFLPVMPSGPVLAISGTRSADLSHICRKRCLHAVETDESNLMDEHILATININEYMVVSCKGCADLVICLTQGDLNHCINAGLDFFLDGESGYWEMASNGRLTKQFPDVSPEQQLAS